ncbi:MAG: hypothetical protein FRX49_01018 [Trebouxia sp. A1-2]|nr:MAG: hypothetical protein FRX49_01018 [Trebouxia sp. A1-2]
MGQYFHQAASFAQAAVRNCPITFNLVAGVHNNHTLVEVQHCKDKERSMWAHLAYVCPHGSPLAPESSSRNLVKDAL